MRYVVAILLFMIFLSSSAQDGADRITFSKFDKPKDIALLDTVKKMLAEEMYGQFISEEKEVYNKASKTDSFRVVENLLQKLSKNGSDDVSQCFYPQHSINFYKKGRIVKFVLVCFDCYGVRFSDERWVTKVKDEKKRLSLMDELKAYFSSQGL